MIRQTKTFGQSGFLISLCLLLCQCETLNGSFSSGRARNVAPPGSKTPLWVQDSDSHGGSTADNGSGHSGLQNKKSQSTDPEVYGTGGSCPANLHPGTVYCHAFKEGCVYIPKNHVSGTHPLVYFRGLIKYQSATEVPASTEFLFSNSDGKYMLKRVAENNGQIILATHHADTTLSAETRDCLLSMNGGGTKLDVASHSGGYKGFDGSRGVLAHHTANVELLDNFYDPEGVASTVAALGADNCSGYYTPHHTSSGASIRSNAAYVRSHTGCDISQGGSHIGDVGPFLVQNLGRSNDDHRYFVKSKADLNGHI